jgi:chromosome segregation ATPase
MLSARNEQTKLAVRIEELEQQLVGALKEERRLIDTVDRFRVELNDCRKALRACTEQCEGLEQALLEAHDDKEKALASACETAEKRALIEAQQCDERIAKAKADADLEIKRCLKDAGKKVAKDLSESQMQLSEYAQRIDVLHASLIDKKRELKCMEKQLADEKIAAEGRVAQAVEGTEARVKMTTKVLRKELSDANAIISEYKQRCEQLQMSLFQAQHDARARESAALDAAAQHQLVIRNLQDEIEAQRALHGAEMLLADTEQAKLAMQVYELQTASAQTGRSNV